MSPKLSSHSLAMLLGWLSSPAQKANRAYCQNTQRAWHDGAESHRAHVHWGRGLGPGGTHVPRQGGQQKCNLRRRFPHSRTQGSWRWGQQTKGDASGHRLWHCTLLYLCQVLLVPHPSKAGLGRLWAQISDALPGSAVNIHEAISPWVPQLPPNKELPFQA